MIIGDYVAKIAALDGDFEAQVEIAVVQQNYLIDMMRDDRILFYPLTSSELEKLRMGLDIERAFDHFEVRLEEYCKDVFGRRRIRA